MSRLSSSSVSISEMKEFASFPAATQRYIRRSLDVAEGRHDVFEIWSRSPAEGNSIQDQDHVYQCIPGVRAAIPENSSLALIESFMGTAVTMAAYDLGCGKINSFGAFRFLYERLLGAPSRPWLPATFLAAAAMPSMHPDIRRLLLQSVSEAAATAAGWSSREPVFFPTWVEKIDMAA